MFTREDRGNFWILNWLDEFMIGHNGFICGGCFKNIFNKENVKDIDMFFESESDYEDAVQYFDSMTPGYEGDDKRSEEYTLYYENDNVKAYKHIRTEVSDFGKTSTGILDLYMLAFKLAMKQLRERNEL
mgnify:CR=1 FL=1